MGTRRGKHEGTIRRRSDGRWEARLVLEDATRRSLYGQTRQEVACLLAAAIRDRELGLYVSNDRQTVDQYLAGWLAGYRHQVKLSSYTRYEHVVRLHLMPGLGTPVLTKLTPQDVRSFYTRELERGASAQTVRYAHILLRAALHDALRLGLVQRNVADLVDPPRRIQREMRILTEAQARTLLEAAAGTRIETLCLVALATGMRVGELLALKWEVTVQADPECSTGTC
jgi:integrase